MTVEPRYGDAELQSLMGDVYSAQILVVDDMKLMRQMIGMSLQKSGYNNIIYASDGDEALETIAAEMPDLVILDLNMPRVSGYEVCKVLRKNPKTQSLPVLIQSAVDKPEERSEVFKAGATDFVSKPINQAELISRVGMHLENRLLIANLTDFYGNMRRELVMAREMQESLLPNIDSMKAALKSHDVVVESYYKASYELGGDLWGAWELPNDKFGFFILDVSGHGVGAALNTFRIHAVMDSLDEEKLDPAAFLKALNDELATSFATGQFATMFYGVLDLKSKELVYAGAGAPRPIVISSEGDIRYLESEGFPVAITNSADYDNKTEQLSQGDCILCYSDVLLEAPALNGEFLGEDGLEMLVQSCKLSHVNDHHLVRTVIDQFMGIVPDALPDDLTAIGIHV